MDAKAKTMKSEKFGAVFFYFLVITLAVAALQLLFNMASTTTISYSEFRNLVTAGKVDNISITDKEISGTIKAGNLDGVLDKKTLSDMPGPAGGEHRFVAVRVDDPALAQDLMAAKLHFSGEVDNHWFSNVLSWVLPAIAFVAIWSFAIRRMAGPGGAAGMGGTGGMLEVGKSHAKVYMEKETGVTFADVAGIDEAKEELIEVVQFLKEPERYRSLGGKIPKGVLIVGSPGTGKTLLAKAVAGEAGVPFFSMSGSEFVEMFVGVGAARVRDLFTQAEAKAPCIVFIDELDALGRARSMSSIGGHDEREQTLNQLLVQMDGFDTNRGVIIMAATNRPEILDPALLRPGRFDRHIALDRPDLAGRKKILEVHARKVKLAAGFDLTAVAAKTAGFAGADLANLVNEAALLAARLGKKQIDASDFDAAFDRIVGGLEKKNRVMNPKEKETVAFHEAGHALVAEHRPHADQVSKISIIPRGVAALGYTQQTPTEDRYLLRHSELLDRLDVLLGGRVAEELVFGDVSTGAQNDLQRATDMARQMVAQFGMSDVVGLATYEQALNPLYPAEHGQVARREYSEQTAQTIDSEIAGILRDAHDRVTRTLSAHRPTLDALALALLQNEVIERPALERLCAQTAGGPQGSAQATPSAGELTSA
jgi:cell division protease FtsH